MVFLLFLTELPTDPAAGTKGGFNSEEGMQNLANLVIK